MRVHVLGSAAGGGFPQWNCNCDNCAGLRRGELDARPRSQSSIAVSDDGQDWVLINASPDIRSQINDWPALQPGRARRDTAIRAVVLMDSQIDHATGLLILREGEPIELFCTDMVHQDLCTGFPLIKMLASYCGVNHHRIGIDGEFFEVPGVPALRFTAIPLHSKAPPYSPHRFDPHPGDNIGLRIESTDSGASVFYAPGLGRIDETVSEQMARADCLMVDGTFWSDDEMQRRGVGRKRAAEMGHLAQSGPGGMVEALGAFPHARKVLIHINNTNPILLESGPERALLTAAAIEVAHDGMEMEITRGKPA